MRLSKTYDHAIDENTPAWSIDTHGRLIHPRVKALDDSVVFLCATNGCSSNDMSHVRLALGQMCEREKVPMQEWNQLAERVPMTIKYLATYKGLSLRSTLDMIRTGDMRFSDIEGALTTGAVKREIKEFRKSKHYKRMIERENLNKALKDFSEPWTEVIERIVGWKYFNAVALLCVVIFLIAAAREVFT